jgi:hypothetical protein
MEHAAHTLLNRQAANGGFYKSANVKTIEIWYTDNIAKCLPQYLNEAADAAGKLAILRHMLRPGQFVTFQKYLESCRDVDSARLILIQGDGETAKKFIKRIILPHIHSWVRSELQDFLIEQAQLVLVSI